MHSKLPGWTVLSKKGPADIDFRVLGIATVFTALALVTVVARWYTRCFMIRRIRIDDVLVLAAMIVSIALTGITGAEAKLDYSNSVREISPSKITTTLALVYAQSIFFYVSINLIKIAIVVQYSVIFSSRPHIRNFCYIILFLVAISSSWGIFGVVFMCAPMQKYWRPELTGSCLNAEEHLISSAVVGITLDFTIWVLPIPIVLRLQLPRRQKIGLLMAFVLGFFVCIVAVLRVVLIHNAAAEGDATKSGTYALIWSTIEVNVAIICACIVVLKPLFDRILPDWSSEPPSQRECNLLYFRSPAAPWPQLFGRMKVDRQTWNELRYDGNGNKEAHTDGECKNRPKTSATQHKRSDTVNSLLGIMGEK